MRQDHNLDFGSVKIHNKAIAEIVIAALHEVPGVSTIPPDMLSNLADLVGVRTYPGIDVDIDKNNQVNINVKVCIRYGLNLPDVARQTQQVIRSAVERAVDIDLKDVNVNIYGIERAK